MSCKVCLTISRKRRRTVLRTTAPPTRRDVMIPTREGRSLDNLKHPILINRDWTDLPCSRTRVNSLLLLSRTDLGNRQRTGSGLRMSCEVDFDTFREQAFAPVAAAAVQNSPAGLGLHAGAETELLLARALGRLVCAFHKFLNGSARLRPIPQASTPKPPMPLLKAEYFRQESRRVLGGFDVPRI